MIIDPNLPSKRNLWVNTYVCVMDGLMKHKYFLGLENQQAKRVADQAIKDHEEQFEKS